MTKIRISEKHGVNPSLQQCFYCLKDMGVILFGRLPNDEEAPRRTCLNKDPCDECKDYMKQGIILISVDEKMSHDIQNPRRTGGWCVVTEDFIRRLVTPIDLAEEIIQRRSAFVPDEAWDLIGLPRPKENNETRTVEETDLPSVPGGSGQQET